MCFFLHLLVCAGGGLDEWHGDVAKPRDEGRRIALGEFRRIRPRMGKCPRRILRSSPGCPKGSNNLPWDVSSIQQKSAPRPEADGWDGVPVCAKAASRDTRRATGGSGTAVTPTVSASYGDGRRPSGSVNGERRLRVGRNMPRRSASGVGESRTRRSASGVGESRTRRSASGVGESRTRRSASGVGESRTRRVYRLGRFTGARVVTQ